MKLIDKFALVAEIEECISTYKRVLNKIDKSSDKLVTSTSVLESKIDALQHILSFLDTIEVKDMKELDLDKEIKDWLNKGDITDTRFDDYEDSDIERTAKHFFELGVRKKKEEKYEVPSVSKTEDVSVTSRMAMIDDDLKPIAEFILDYAGWNLHKDEWNHPVLEVPLFRVLDALIQRGKPYCEKN